MSQSPVVDRIRIIPRPSDFLDRNVGSSGEVFFNKETSSLRVFSGNSIDRGGFEIARSDLTNISNSVFSAKATAAGITGATPDWGDITNKPTFADVSISGSYNDLIDTPSIPDISQLATQSYVDNAIANIPANDSPSQSFSLVVTGDDSTLTTINSGETFQISGGTGITTSVDVEGKITITASSPSTQFDNLTDVNSASLTVDKIYEPAIVMLRVDNNGTTAYTFNSHYSGNNPTIYAISGTTIAFDLDAIPGHPFEIQDNTLTALTTNLVHVATDGTVSTDTAAQGKDSGTLYFRIPENSISNYTYQCQNHAAMFGTITVKRLSTL